MLTRPILPSDHGRRLESFLRMLMPGAAAGYCRTLIKNGAVRLNGAVAFPDRLLLIGDTVTIKESRTVTACLEESPPGLDILYEDGSIVIVNKPPGLPMHRTSEPEANCVDEGSAYMARRGTPCKLYPVNRLDRGTSGAVIMAKSSAAAGCYGRQVKESGLDKLYLALVPGIPPESGMIDAPLDGRESETRYRILCTGNAAALLAVTPVSGRMHQIRRHLEAIGHPVMGDKRYGGTRMDGYEGFALHSFRTVVVRPEAGPLTVCAPLPPGLFRLCASCGITTEQVLKDIMSLTGSTTPCEEPQ